jgi:citrate lyase subunit beta/citryl-CoA lyase
MLKTEPNFKRLMMHTPLRSVLYLPASNLRALEKAKSLDADALILDLEDAVLPQMKAMARAQAIAAVQAGGFGFRQVIIRVNGLETPWGAEDLAALQEAKLQGRLQGILVPKVNKAQDLSPYLGLDCPLWAMMETAQAMLNAAQIVTAQGLTTLVMGTNDLAKETRTRLIQGRAPMLPWLMTCLAAARTQQLAIIDGVYNAINDESGFTLECQQARDCGFEGKTLIHPSQIAPCNLAFAPSEEEVLQAKEIIAAFAAPENQGKGSLSVNGKMVEILHAEMAQGIVLLAKALDAR